MKKRLHTPIQEITINKNNDNLYAETVGHSGNGPVFNAMQSIFQNISINKIMEIIFASHYLIILMVPH